MGQKTLNEKMGKTSTIGDIDELLDDEGWDILNSLTEDELALLNSDFDPENMLIPTGERINHDRHTVGATKQEAGQKKEKPMFSQKDLVKTMDSMTRHHQKGERPTARSVNSTLSDVSVKPQDEKNMFNQKELVASLNKMVAQSKESDVYKNDKIRQKEEERKKQKEAQLYKKEKDVEKRKQMENDIVLTTEEELLLMDATEEELIEAAALLNMSELLTSDQINAVYAGDKPEGTMKTSVKSAAPKQARITKSDVETELDVVELNKHLKSDSDSLFYLCVNNQPLLERETLELIIQAVANTKKMRHLSLAMLGIADKHAIALADAIGKNTLLETLNLDSNVIGMPGIEALMNVVGSHPSLREVKCSNQKQPFGGQGEDCMASAVVKNQNILKFGYSFRQAAPRNKADRAIIKNNEIMRQRRKKGEEIYDLKEVCKIRDPWPQPWIKVKGQRQLGSQLADKVTDMGLMIDVDNDTGRESRGPKVEKEREAKPLDIAALLAARANKLKGTNVGNLEKENEERRKKTLLAMKQSEEEAGRIGTIMKVTPGLETEGEVAKSPSPAPSLGTNEITPPVTEEKEEEVEEPKAEESTAEVVEMEKVEHEEKKEEEEEGSDEEDSEEESDDEFKVTKKEPAKPAEPEPAPKKDVGKLGKFGPDGMPLKDTTKEDEEKKKQEEEEKKKKEEEEKKKKEEEEKKKKEEEDEDSEEDSDEEDSEDEEEEKKKKEEEEKKKKEEEAKKIKAEVASLAPASDAAPLRRRKKDDDEESAGGLFDEAPKEEKPLTAAEEGAEALGEGREALAARKAAQEQKAAPPAEEKKEEPKLTAAEEGAEALGEGREALAARKAAQEQKAAPPAEEKKEEPKLTAAEEGAEALGEGREALAAEKAALDSTPTPAAAPAPAPAPAPTPKVELDEGKPLSLKERRALLAEKKRLLGE